MASGKTPAGVAFVATSASIWSRSTQSVGGSFVPMTSGTNMAEIALGRPGQGVARAMQAPLARRTDPLVVPPAVTGDDSDIAFCSSAVPDARGIWLYYTISDKYPFRVRVE